VQLLEGKNGVMPRRRVIVVKGIKGFYKGMICKGDNCGVPYEKQYAENTEYAEDVKPKCCQSGMHFVENPLDVFGYYNPGDSEYAEVEAIGDIARQDDDSKISTNKLKVGLKIDLKGVIKAGIDFIFEKTKSSSDTTATTGYGANAATTGDGANAATTGDGANAATTGYRANAATTGDGANAATTGYRANAATTGYGANAATTGDRANAATTGDRANAATTGYRANAATTGDGANAATTGYGANTATTGYGANAATTGDRANAATTGYGANAATTGYRANAATTGENTIAAAIGIDSMAKSSIGSWIVCAEWKVIDGKYTPVCVKAVKVDGDAIKADTYYKLKNGEFVVAQ
jgi:hypothetical protein